MMAVWFMNDTKSLLVFHNPSFNKPNFSLQNLEHFVFMVGKREAVFVENSTEAVFREQNSVLLSCDLWIITAF